MTREGEQKKRMRKKKPTGPTVAERLDGANLRLIEDSLCVLESFPEIRSLPLGKDLRKKKKEVPFGCTITCLEVIIFFIIAVAYSSSLNHVEDRKWWQRDIAYINSIDTNSESYL